MIGKNNALLTTIFLFEFFKFSFEVEEYYDFDRTKNDIFCANLKTGCIFNVSYNYPFSPRIPNEIPVKSILSTYRYIYLIFKMPKNKQKQFSLMAYDISDKKTIISNGDYYNIDLNVNYQYEIRIYNSLKKGSFVEFLFLGLEKDFTMQTEIRFALDLNLYYYDFKLDKDNSLASEKNKAITKYYKAIQALVKKKLKDIEYAIYNINQILKKHFDITMSFSKEELKISKTVFVPPCFIVTGTIASELTVSLSKFMNNDDDDKYQVLSAMIIEKDKINYQIDGSDLIKDLMKEDQNVFKTFQSYFGNVENIFLESSLEYEQLCVTISYHLNSIKYSLSFTEDHKYMDQIYYIEIDIEITNPAMLKPAPVYAYSINWNTVHQKVKPILEGVIFFLTTAASIAGFFYGINNININVPQFGL